MKSKSATVILSGGHAMSGTTDQSDLFVATFPSSRLYTRIFKLSIRRRGGEEESYTTLKSGKSVGAKNLQIALHKADRKKAADFLGNMYRLPIISTKARQVFDEQGIRNIEYLPVNIVGVSLPKADFSLANILGTFDIVDWSRTKCARMIPDNPNSTISSISHLVLKQSNIPGVQIFYMDEPRRLVMKRSLAEAIIKEKLSGIQMHDILTFNFET